MLKNMGIGAKVYLLAGLLIALSAISALFASLQIRGIDSQINTIAETALPLARTVKSITTIQMRQSLLLERSMRISGQLAVSREKLSDIMNSDKEYSPAILQGSLAVTKKNMNALMAVKKKFKATSPVLLNNLATVKNMFAAILKNPKYTKQKVMFKRGYDQIVSLEKNYSSFKTYVDQVYYDLKIGNMNGANEKIKLSTNALNTTMAATRIILKKLANFVTVSVSEARKNGRSAEVFIMSLAFGSFVFGSVLAFLIARSITLPVKGITDIMGVLAAGDTSVEITGTSRGDEIGNMSKAVEVFKVNMIQNNEMTEKQKQENEIKEQRRRAVEKTANTFETGVTEVLGAVAKASEIMRSTAQGMAATAEETANQSSTVAAAAEKASTNVQTVASAAEELASSITEISRQVSQSTQIANTAVQAVDGANEKIQSLVDAAKKIGEVVALITDIADQTNLLALNATIEAARAGDAGKGFAVVASEVKNLANQTAKATEDISAQIGGIQDATQGAVSAIASIGGTINQMSEISSTIAAAVEEQGAATQEIARNVEQAASGTNEVTSNISGVNQAATDTGQAAEQVLAAAGTLSTESDNMNSQVQTFLKDIKAT